MAPRLKRSYGNTFNVRKRNTDHPRLQEGIIASPLFLTFYCKTNNLE